MSPPSNHEGTASVHKARKAASSGRNFSLMPLMSLSTRVQVLDEAIPTRIASLLKEVHHTQDRLQAILEAEQQQQTPTEPVSLTDRHA